MDNDFNDKDSKENEQDENKGDYNFVYSRRAWSENNQYDEPKKKKKKIKFVNYKKNSPLLNIIWVLVAVVVFFIGTFVWLWQKGDIKINDFRNSGSTTANIPSLVIQDAPEDEGALTSEQIYEKVCGSIVGIAVYDYDASIFSDLVGQGSGIIISEDGYIATNSHVIGDSSKKRVTVVFKNDEKAEEIPAKVVGYDKETDVAVVKIEKKDLKPTVFGNSGKVKPGSTCYAIGNPGGLDFYGSITRGIVSAVNRSINKSEVRYIQTDAAINPGNSGGALVNAFGQVIAMNSGKIASVEFEGMAFAIPSETLVSVTGELISKGSMRRARLGVKVKNVGIYQSTLYDVPLGVVIIEIMPGSSLKGIVVGDILTDVNGTAITDTDSLSSEIRKHKAGETVKLSAFRHSATGENKTFKTQAVLIEDKGD
ncbi:MAG: trypsin-like peptidase domain-containing protein [Oscillospiraceae bacterium]|nr:trypsin-like peptidase domain-containing protein [Oscillospiraceae bacterium]